MTPEPTRSDLPNLTAPREQVKEELSRQIAKGHGYRAASPESNAELATFLHKVQSWGDYNLELLRRRFSTSAIADAYGRTGERLGGAGASLENHVEFLHKVLYVRTGFLSRLKDRLPLYDEAVISQATENDLLRGSDRETIFLVHGHNRAAEQEVLRFLEHVAEARPIVLHDQPNQGRTIIEKFEANAARAAYAVVLLTADDEGRARDGSLAPRSRQNVVFELGYFFGLLGRRKVDALYEPGTELPSDVGGLAYIELDGAGGWKLRLVGELQAAGLTVHVDRMIPG